MRHLIVQLLGMTLLMVVFFGCDKKGTEPETQNGQLIVHLTDAPANFDAVNITFSEISVHLDSEWVNIALAHDSTVNLLDWSNGRSVIIGQSDVPSGHYSQVRLKIKSADIIVDNETFPLAVPSGAQTGLKLGFNFDVNPGATYELVLDFDADLSIVIIGSKKNPRGYKLKPHIRVISKALSGSISGVVTNPGDLPIACTGHHTHT